MRTMILFNIVDEKSDYWGRMWNAQLQPTPCNKEPSFCLQLSQLPACLPQPACILNASLLACPFS